MPCLLNTRDMKVKNISCVSRVLSRPPSAGRYFHQKFVLVCRSLTFSKKSAVFFSACKRATLIKCLIVIRLLVRITLLSCKLVALGVEHSCEWFCRDRLKEVQIIVFLAVRGLVKEKQFGRRPSVKLKSVDHQSRAFAARVRCISWASAHVCMASYLMLWLICAK